MNSKNINYIHFALLLPAIGLVIYMNWCGLGLTNDSLAFISIAENFLKHGFFNYNHEMLQYKPPAFPYIIALIGKSNMFIFNLVCYVSYCFLLFQLVKRELTDASAIGVYVLLLISTPIFMVHHFLWTEPIANLLLVALLIFSVKIIDKFSLKTFLIIIGLCWMLILVRHAAIFLVVGIGFGFLIVSRFKKWAMVFAPLSVFPMLIWHFLKPESYGFRLGQIQGISAQNNFYKITHNIYMLLEGLSSYLFPIIIPESLRVVVTVVLVALFFVYAIRTSNNRLVLFYISLIVCYCILMLSVFKIPSDGERYMIPVFIVLLAAIIKFMNGKWKLVNTHVAKVLFVMIFSMVFYNAVRSVKNIIMWHEVTCQNVMEDINSK